MKLDLEKKRRKQFELKITNKACDDNYRYQTLQVQDVYSTNQLCTKIDKNNTIRFLKVDLVGLATTEIESFHHNFHNLQNSRPIDTTFDMNGPNFATKTSPKNFQRQSCFLEKTTEANTPHNFPNSKQKQLSARECFKLYEATTLDYEKTELIESNQQQFAEIPKIWLGNTRTDFKKLSNNLKHPTNSKNQQSNQTLCVLLIMAIMGQTTNRSNNSCLLIKQPANPSQGNIVTNHVKNNILQLANHCNDQVDQLINLSQNDRATQHGFQISDQLERSPKRKNHSLPKEPLGSCSLSLKLSPAKVKHC